jgi:hypothetical protein
MLDRSLSVVAAVGMAALVWLYARSRDQELLDNVAVPVQVVLDTAQAHHYNLEVAGVLVAEMLASRTLEIVIMPRCGTRGHENGCRARRLCPGGPAPEAGRCTLVP